MWKKDEETSAGEPPVESTAGTRPTRAGAARGEAATIGASITIKGEVSGDEDLLIQGRVDGSVTLEDQSVTVGRDGRVKADITGRVLIVEGTVNGNLQAAERVVLRETAKVEGDITAPRVVLEDGAAFRGLVDMRESSSGSGSSARPASVKESPEDTKSNGKSGSEASSAEAVRPTSSTGPDSPKGGRDRPPKKGEDTSRTSGPEKAAS